MSRDQDQLSQLVRYASLCDILAGCSQFTDLVSVCDYITKKLKYVINGYAWTYHAVRDGGVQIVARKSKRLSVTKEPLDELMAHREFCRHVSTMVAVDLDESKGQAEHLCEPLVIDRLRQVLIVPIRRNQAIEAYVAYYAKDQCFDELDKKFILVSGFVMTRWNRLRRARDSKRHFWNWRKRSVIRLIETSIRYGPSREHATQRIGQLHCLNRCKSR